MSTPPIEWGSTCMFYRCLRRRPLPRQVTPVTQGTPAQFFLEACFLFPRALAFDFFYDLDLCSQGQTFDLKVKP